MEIQLHSLLSVEWNLNVCPLDLNADWKTAAMTIHHCHGKIHSALHNIDVNSIYVRNPILYIHTYIHDV